MIPFRLRYSSHSLVSFASVPMARMRPFFITAILSLDRGEAVGDYKDDFALFDLFDDV